MISQNSTSRAPAVTEGHEVAGRYVLRQLLASGGMAQVWRADDTVLGRAVAIKLLHAHLAGDSSFVDRFRDEARSAARLSHQSIVSIFDTASEDGVEAIVMELIDGMTLREYLDAYKRLSLDDAVDLITQVADALDTAHAARIVHRDIKPGNIMLCPDRRVKVTDFGIAKALEDGDRTSQGTLLGTAKYLAPEQVEGTPVDPRADIYSLGVVLYEALTGAAPFDSDNDSATALARLHTDPRSPREINPAIPSGVEQVVLTALARDRDHRYASAGSMAAALATAVAHPDAPVIESSHTTTTTDPTLQAAGGSADPTRVHAGGLDRTLAREVDRAAPDNLAAPTGHGNGPGPRARGRRLDLMRPLLVLLVVGGCLALAVSLIFATGAGRGFLDRVGDNVTGADDATQPEDAPNPSRNNSSPAGDTDDPTTEPDATDNSAEIEQAGGRSDSGALTIADVSDFDPLGDGNERPGQTRRVIDGDIDTMWSSERYSNRALGNLKEGVGLVLSLDGEQTLSSLTVESPTQGWAARVYLADAPTAELSGWGEPIDGRVGIAGGTTFDLRGVRASAVLLWITDLGDAAPRLRVEIAEVTLS